MKTDKVDGASACRSHDRPLTHGNMLVFKPFLSFVPSIESGASLVILRSVVCHRLLLSLRRISLAICVSADDDNPK